MNIGGRVDRMLRPLHQLDAAVDVDGTPAGGLELTVESQARGDADACSQQLLVAAEVGELHPPFESAQDLIARVVQIILVELIHPGGVSAVGTLV